MKSSTFLLLSLSFFAFAGCAGVVRTYSGEPKNLSQIAVVKSRANEFAATGNRYLVFFASYSKLEPGSKLDFQQVGNAFAGYPSEMHMLPGKYLVMTRCVIGGQYAFPSFTLEAVAGATYEVLCSPVADQLGRVKVTVQKIEAHSRN